MNLFRKVEQQEATVVGFGVRTLLISSEGLAGNAAHRLAGLGSVLEASDEFYAGLELVIEDPTAYGLLVIECDGFGGLDACKRAQTLLAVINRVIPMILISSECTSQSFPDERREPTVLRAPVSAISLRVGLEHAMRDRLLMTKAS